MVSTANLLPIDWRDIENVRKSVTLHHPAEYVPQSVWMQDFPLRSTPVSHDPKATDFPATWANILHSLNVVPALLTMGKNGVRILLLSITATDN